MSITSVKNDVLTRESVINAFTPLAPTISSYDILVAAVIIDDTAVDTAGGQTIQINGTSFAPGAIITLGGSAVTTAYVSPNKLTFTAPAKTAGSYAIYVVNLDGGTAIYIPGIVYSGTPVWTTASGTLGSVYETNSISTTALVTTGDAPITYSLYSGTLPTGSSLNTSTGVITGTAPVDSSSTVYPFTIKATDAQLQDSLQNFNLTINTDVVTWTTPASGSTTTISQNAASTTTLLATSAAGKAITYSSTALPTGLSISGATVTGTPTVLGTTATTFTATAATTGRTTTAVINWTISVANDQYFMYTPLSLSGGTATETFIADASVNNFALTIAGDTKPNNFNPYTPGYYSNYFNGTGDYLSLPSNSSSSFGTNNFTVECWVYMTANSSYRMLLGNGSSYLCIVSGAPNAYYSGVSLSSTGTVPLNTWTHVAFVRISGVMYFYINGVLSGSGAFAGTWGAVGVSNIGYSSAYAGLYYYAGYLSNLRIVNGVAVYTANFTPPTTPLSATQASGTNIAAITGSQTSLLTCQSNRFLDNSTNLFTLTQAGNPQIQSATPFVPNTAYAAYGSTYFDGTTDYLTIPPNTTIAFASTVTFTVEFWIYPTAYATGASFNEGRTIISTCGTYPEGWRIEIDTANIILYSYVSGVTISTPISINIWTHVAVTHNGTTSNLYKNGVLAGSGATSWTAGVSSPFFIGCLNNVGSYLYPYLGYISNIRLVKGVAVYTANFTPPTTPLSATQLANTNGNPSADITGSQTSLLTLQTNQPANNSVFLDSSTNALAVTRAGNTTQGTSSPYGANWSNYFNGSSYMVPATGINAAMGTGFAGNIISFEMWIFPTTFTNGGDGNGIMGAYGAVAANGRWLVSMERSATTTAKLQMAYTISTGSQVNIDSTASAITLNQWNHIAITVDATTAASSTIKLFANGVLLNTFTGQNMSTQTAYYRAVYIGDVQSQYVSAMVGYISNFRILKGAFAYTGNYTVPTAPLTAIANTVLLTCQSNSSVDNSANAFALSLAGPPTVQRFSPFGPHTQTANTHSTYFDGSTDWITLPSSSSAYNITGDFTVEAWVYATAQAGYDWGIIDARVGGATPSAWLVLLAPSGAGHVVRFYNAGPNTGTTVIPLNTWAHIAVVRSGTALRTFVNGSQDLNNTTYGSGPISPGATAPRLGSSKDASGTNYMTKGYISNFRFVNGVAVYTGAFTPPTAPLTATQSSGTNIAAITGTATSLLTFQSPTLIDASTNAFVLTPSTTTIKPRTYNPFGFTNTLAGYSAATYGGSAYFDGSGDYLTTPTTSVFNLSATQWTIELWVYFTAMPGTDSRLVCIDSSVGTFGFFTKVAGSIWLSAFGASERQLSAAASIPLKQWKHIAFTKTGASPGTIRCFVDGVMTAYTVTDYTFPNASSAVSIADSVSQYSNANYTGYISNVRVVKGTVVYTSNFVPPTAPVTAITNTSLLLNMTSASVYDSTSIDNLETVGDAKRVATQTPYAGSYYSNYFDGTGDYLTVATNAVFNFSTGDFTLEAWIYRTALPENSFIISASGSGGLFFGFATGGDIGWGRAGVAWDYQFAGNIVVNTWYHVALTRSGTSMKMFVNGTQLGVTQNIATSYNISTSALHIGSQGGNYYFTGYISNARVVKGVAVYTSTFTPPSTPLSATQGAVSLSPPPTVEYLVVAGGGGGASAISSNTRGGGGGGAGGFRTSAGLSVTVSTTYTITVGAAGTNGTALGVDGGDGTASIFSTITSAGGGGGGSEGRAGRNGGSGGGGSGGAAGGSGNTPSTSPSQGNNGGASTSSAGTAGGSGGGAGGAGTSGASYGYSSIVPIGPGSNSSITGTGITYSAGGTGGGSSGDSPANATVNSGNGGQGGGNPLGGLGGSGIVVIRYADTYAAATCTGSPVITVAGGYRIYKFVTSGTMYITFNTQTIATITGTAGTATSLLTCQSNRFIDNSSNAFAMTRTGEVSVQSFNPFQRNSAATLYFDGTGDYLVAPYNPAYNFGTGNFTIEFWVNTTSTAAYATALRLGNTWTTGSWSLYLNDVNGSGVPSWWSFTLNTTLSTSGVTINDGAWHHIALVRNSTTMTMYIDGTSRGTLAVSTSSVGDTTTQLWIARDASNVRELAGYINDLRITKGVARYTTTFTPPTSSPLAY